MKQLLTPDEASRRICPHIQAKDTYVYCKGTMCMGWEWESVQVPQESNGYIKPPKFEKTDKGYCGA